MISKQVYMSGLLLAAVFQLPTATRATGEMLDMAPEVWTRPLVVSIAPGDGDCWTNFVDVQEALLLPLRQSGFRTADMPKDGDLSVTVNVISLRNSIGVCVGSMVVVLGQFGLERYPEGTWVYTKSIQAQQYILTSGGTLDSQLVDAAEAVGRAFANILLDARNESSSKP